MQASEPSALAQDPSLGGPRTAKGKGHRRGFSGTPSLLSIPSLEATLFPVYSPATHPNSSCSGSDLD